MATPVTESKLRTVTGLSANQIRHRRPAWRECGICFRDPMGAVMYELRGVQALIQPYVRRVSSCCGVYLIGAPETDLVKIGFSVNVFSRMKNLQVFSPVDLTLFGLLPFETTAEAKAAERFLHEKYHKYRERGEWFWDVEAIRKEFEPGLVTIGFPR